MTLAELKKLAIRKQMRIRFVVDSAEAFIDEHGIARVPSLRNVPSFNLDEALGSVTQFKVESLGADGKPKASQTAKPEDLVKLVASLHPAGPAKPADDHDE
ncbi:MAG: hypothetical protein JNK87_32580 [Bryobacterales bacterium]|nr:hypothetical protein [Bryobacterales bacterium]